MLIPVFRDHSLWETGARRESKNKIISSKMEIQRKWCGHTVFGRGCSFDTFSEVVKLPKLQRPEGNFIGERREAS